ncbi:MAG TPA: FHA domain-containing protein [Chitinophagaceae bacterium]|jgi:hypothetical protein|nr:FHA domain-containing protein [Chitinophagaceae bacterium]
MFDLFKQDKESKSGDVKLIRNTLVQFIKEQLKKVEGGEGNNIKGLYLFITCPDAEKHIYESALYFEEGDRFKNEEVQKIADDFAIDLPQDWVMEISFVDSAPPEAIKVTDLDASLFIQTRKRSIKKSATAYITVLNGEAEKEMYSISSSSGIINIGREKKVQTADGFFRINNIAFPAESSHQSNQYISRQHAHIEFDGESGHFLLFADEGGLPPRNKIKVRSTGGVPVKLQTAGIGHQLQEGDQIILGETALLQFSYSPLED